MKTLALFSLAAALAVSGPASAHMHHMSVSPGGSIGSQSAYSGNGPETGKLKVESQIDFKASNTHEGERTRESEHRRREWDKWTFRFERHHRRHHRDFDRDRNEGGDEATVKSKKGAVGASQGWDKVKNTVSFDPFGTTSALK